MNNVFNDLSKISNSIIAKNGFSEEEIHEYFHSEDSAKTFLGRCEPFITAEELLSRNTGYTFISLANKIISGYSSSLREFILNRDKLIFHSSVIEGAAKTLYETLELLNRVNDTEDSIKVKNIANAHSYVVDNHHNKITVEGANRLNRIINNDMITDKDGLRISDVLVSGTNYRPKIPNYLEYENLIEEFNNAKTVEDVITAGVKYMKMQPYLDGNKRVSTFLINWRLLQLDLGVLFIGDTREGFSSRLVAYYENEEVRNDLIYFLRRKVNR